METINWDNFSGSYLQLEDGEPVELLLTGWKESTETFEDKVVPTLIFEVMSENNNQVEKIWTVTSKRLAMLLKPAIEDAEKNSRNTIKIRVIKTGEGFKTNYSVKVL